VTVPLAGRGLDRHRDGRTDRRQARPPRPLGRGAGPGCQCGETSEGIGCHGRDNESDGGQLEMQV
jgi:hypothetical protein